MRNKDNWTNLCSKCKKEKEPGRANCYCRVCDNLIHREYRLKKRLEKGKPLLGSGRSPLCSTCKQPKEPGRENESRCKKCKSEANKAKRITKRADAGLPLYGSGRKSECSKCGSIKENKSFGYCNKCNRERENEYRIRTGKTKNRRTGKCKCGQAFRNGSKDYCNDCKCSQEKLWRDKNPEKLKEIRKRADEKQKSKPDAWIKMAARRMTRTAIRKGVLIKDFCEKCSPLEVCYTFDSVQAHHDDYSRPLEVRWLCTKHHAEHHKNVKD